MSIYEELTRVLVEADQQHARQRARYEETSRLLVGGIQAYLGVPPEHLSFRPLTGSSSARPDPANLALAESQFLVDNWLLAPFAIRFHGDRSAVLMTVHMAIQHQAHDVWRIRIGDAGCFDVDVSDAEGLRRFYGEVSDLLRRELQGLLLSEPLGPDSRRRDAGRE